MKRILVLALAAFTLNGCAGTMNGMVRDSGETVVISYEQGMSYDDLVVVMPDGEKFTGKAVMAGSSSGIGWGTTGTSSAFGVVQTYTGNMWAVLFGDRNNTMQCKLQYADSSGYTSSGGVGLCETSDGRLVDVLW